MSDRPHVIRPSGSMAVMAQRREPPDSLDLFCTPPWATRALVHHVLGFAGPQPETVWEPAAGCGHMAEVLRETFATVHASDVHDYGRGDALGSFVGDGPDRAECPFPPDWIITNPPYRLAEAFALRAVNEARVGVALLLRTAWMEGLGRYAAIFRKIPPTTVAIFAERVPMVKGRWDPEASTATAYAWFVWRHPIAAETQLTWIPPGQRESLTRPDDVRRFCTPAAVPLFEGET